MSRPSFFCDVFNSGLLQIMKSYLQVMMINPIPNNNFSDWSKLKAFADDKINTTYKQFFFGGRGLVENIVGIGENAGY